MASMFLCVAQPILAQGDPQMEAIQQKLNQQVVVSKITNQNDIATAGSIVVLQKEGLWMCGITAVGPYENTYKNGKYSVGRFGWGMLAGLLKVDTNTIPQLKFAAGDKFWVIGSSVDKNGIHFRFLSDPINDVRYYTQLKLPFDKKGPVPSADDAMKMIAEVFTVQPSEAPVQSAPAPAPEAAPPIPEPPAAIAPPPPPLDTPPAPPKTISLGQTKDQVIAILGQPVKKATLGPKEIYYYPDMKVVLINGKVKDVQ
jgi:hypothetical protein